MFGLVYVTTITISGPSNEYLLMLLFYIYIPICICIYIMILFYFIIDFSAYFVCMYVRMIMYLLGVGCFLPSVQIVPQPLVAIP